MLETHSISRFLESNSSINPKPVLDTVEQATLKTKYRPDKMCPRDQYVKWDLIFSGIDTPHRLARGGMVGVLNRTWIATELNELKDFKI